MLCVPCAVQSERATAERKRRRLEAGEGSGRRDMEGIEGGDEVSAAGEWAWQHRGWGHVGAGGKVAGARVNSQVPSAMCY